MRKSQADIAGLALVVILAALAVIFFVKNSVSEDFVGFDDQISSKVGSKFILSLLDTTTDCNKMSLEEVLLICANGKNLVCGEVDACNYFEGITGKIIGKTLEQWNKAYYLTISQDIKIMEFGGKCREGQISSSLTLPADTGLLSLKMDICG
jgi:hypothetical protein